MDPNTQSPENQPVTPPSSVPPVVDSPAASAPSPAAGPAPDALPATPPTPDPSVVPSAFPDPVVNTVVSQPAPQFQQTVQIAPAAPVMAPAKKKIGGLVAGIIGGLVLLGGIVAALIFFVFPSGKISESDLITATLDGNSYLRPKQWKEIKVGDKSGFGDKLGKNETSTALIYVEKDTYLKANLKDEESSKLSSFKKAVVEMLTEATVATQLKSSLSCSDVKGTTIDQSGAVTKNSVGIFRATSTCVKDGSDFVAIYYGYVGNDGYARTLLFAAEQKVWDQNKAVFNKMIDSADQE